MFPAALIKFVAPLLSLLALFALSNAQLEGTIVSPANGTQVTPGQQVPLSYIPLADYGTSTVNILVCILIPSQSTSTTTDIPLSSLVNGDCLGLYQIENYPGTS